MKEHSQNPYAPPYTVATAQEDVRAEFIKKTYLHVAGAIGVFALIEYFLVNSVLAEKMTRAMTGGYTWLLVLGAFMLVGWIADKWAHSNASRGMQYLGLGLFIVAEAIIFLPLLWVADNFAPGAIQSAGWTTLALFLGLTIFAFTTRKDFSFLRGALVIGGFIALGTIVAGILFGFSLGIWFSGIMVVFAAASVLYTTSNIIHHYQPQQYVAASLSLFSGIALMFWYILQIFMSFSSE